MKSISYAVTVCNELEELVRLMNLLQIQINSNDEIVVQYDKGNTTQEILDYLNIQQKIYSNLKVVGFPLNNDFASFKNNLANHCTGDYIFSIDADEYPHEFLIQNLGMILEANQVDIIFVPRVNTVEGITDEHITRWRWKLDKDGRVNWPDYQSRIYVNNGVVGWKNKVHETITNYDTFSNFPPDEKYALYHPKDIERQERQNNYYNTI
jgi:glycosyltransferase involved in cell wall biosynthesis